VLTIISWLERWLEARAAVGERVLVALRASGPAVVEQGQGHARVDQCEHCGDEPVDERVPANVSGSRRRVLGAR
jgi:phage major head subunit gpT-like protein